MFYKVEIDGPAKAKEALKGIASKYKDFQYIGGKAVAAKLDAASARKARQLVTTLNKDLDLDLSITVTTC